MIESHVMAACQKLAKPGGRVVLLGDQIPAFGCGFSSNKDWAASLGMSCLSIDYDGKADVQHDLNFPIDASLKETADILYDGGVLEHVANIGEAWKTSASLVKPGGYIIHCNPINCYGGAYYGLDPMLFRDFYEANGFTVLRNDIYYRTGWRIWTHTFVLKYMPEWFVKLLKRKLNTQAAKDFVMKDDITTIRFQPLAETKPLRFSPPLAHTFFIARKDKTVLSWTWPAQSCYPKA